MKLGARIAPEMEAAVWGVGLLVAAAAWPSPHGTLGLVRSPLVRWVGVGLLLAPVLRWLASRLRRAPSSRVVVLAAFAVFSIAGQHHVSRIQASGDEPHYLLMAQSLWREHDLDLRDNMERRDYEEYTPGPLVPHYGEPRKDGRPFPAHSPGLPALLAPVYALGGRRASVLILAVLAAALVAETARWARRASLGPNAESFAAVLLASSPVFAYSFHVYSETAAALATWVALRWILDDPGPWRAAGAGLLASTLPWLHVRMIPAAAVLGCVALFRLGSRSRWSFAGTVVAMAAAYVGFFEHVFGAATPLALYGGIPREVGDSRPLRALGGLLLDRSFGLLPYAPAFLLSLAPAGIRRRPSFALLLVAGVLLPVLTWRVWWGGLCPPGRFLVPILPALALTAAQRVSERPCGLSRWAYPLLVCQVALLAVAVWRPENRLLLNRIDRPPRLWSALSEEGGVSVGSYLPSLTAREGRDATVTAIWIAALGSLLVADRLAARRRLADALFTRPTAAIAWLAATLVSIDALALPPAPGG